jgi:hypothetical protein
MFRLFLGEEEHRARGGRPRGRCGLSGGASLGGCGGNPWPPAEPSAGRPGIRPQRQHQRVDRQTDPAPAASHGGAAAESPAQRTCSPRDPRGSRVRRRLALYNKDLLRFWNIMRLGTSAGIPQCPAHVRRRGSSATGAAYGRLNHPARQRYCPAGPLRTSTCVVRDRTACLALLAIIRAHMESLTQHGDY